MKTTILFSQSENPFENLALEEYAIQNFGTTKEDFLILYVNKPSVIVGRNQNIYEEINLEYCFKNNIEICRRVSGGGTVFHDLGNLNWTFITAFDGKKVNQYTSFASPIMDVLKSLGVESYLDDRNAIKVNDVKISGQAQFTNRKNILSHGTLLVNASLDFLQPAIESKEEISSKAAKSVRSQVQNLEKLLNRKVVISEIIKLLEKQYNTKVITGIDFSAFQEKIVKYKSDKWIYQRSPKSIVTKKIEGITFTFYIEKGIVISVKDERDLEINQSPFLHQTYENLIRNNYFMYSK